MPLLLGESFHFHTEAPTDSAGLVRIMQAIRDVLAESLPDETVDEHVEFLVSFPLGTMQIEVVHKTAKGARALAGLFEDLT